MAPRRRRHQPPTAPVETWPKKSPDADFWSAGVGPVPRDVWEKSTRVSTLVEGRDGPHVVLRLYEGAYFLQIASATGGWGFAPAVYVGDGTSAREGASEGPTAADCDHSHPPSVETLPCPPSGAKEDDSPPAVAPVAYESALEGAICMPRLRIERNDACLAAGKHIVINNAADVYAALGPTLAKEDQEVSILIPLDVRHQVRGGYVECHRGAQSHVDVDCATLMKCALTAGAERFVVVHNHPSGTASPSKADRELTKTIELACAPYGEGLMMLDHVVIGRKEYYSFAESKRFRVK